MLDQPSYLKSLIESLPIHLAERARLYGLGRFRGLGTVSNATGSSPALPAHSDHPVVYWTHHAMRLDENPAFEVASHLAKELGSTLLVYYGISENYRFASDRHHLFSLQGARDLQLRCRSKGVRLVAHVDRRDYRVPALRLLAERARILVTDEFPGEPTEGWLERLRSKIATPIVTVDASCVVPMQLVGKAYDRAFAYRDGTQSLYDERIPLDWPQGVDAKAYEGEVPFVPIALDEVDLCQLIAQCDIDHSVGPVSDTEGGSTAGYQRWDSFCETTIRRYAKLRNDPNSGVASRMSAYLHYGMVSPMRLARDSHRLRAEKYLEELLLWRELAYSYCFHRDDYESTESLPQWARRTLQEHERDPREAYYSWESLARAKTDDRLWNACQQSLLRHGELHNNVRMTWGKALLGWTRNADEALRKLIDLNHRYALDGRDPASYGGILWCLGQFDRPFTPEQSVTGTVRTRSSKEHANRLDLERYEKHVTRAPFDSMPRIAIVGAGLGGIMCGRILQDHGFDVQLFDKSRGAGGRSATRRLEKSLQFDHGAQYFTCKDPRTAKFVESWLDDGIVAPWLGEIVEWKDNSVASSKSNCNRLVGTPSMSSIGRHIAKDLAVVHQTKVIRTEKEVGGRYRLWAAADEFECSSSPRDLGLFDAVLWNCPAPQTLPLVPDGCAWKPFLGDVKMGPCWGVMVAFCERWNVPFDGAFINEGPIRWIARDSSKPNRPKELDCWVIHTSNEWTNEQLAVNRELIPDMVLKHLSECVRVPMPEPLFRQAQRWLFANVITPYSNDDCFWDPVEQLGACGDWFRSSNIEGALLSGMALAGRVLGSYHSKHQQHLKQGLQSKPLQLKLF